MRRITVSPVSVLTFSFLFSGNILFGLYYSSENPVVCYIFASLFLVIFTFIVAKWFCNRKNISQRPYAVFVSVTAGMFALFPAAYTLFVYAKSLGTFADYYSSAFVTVFAVLVVIISGICAAKKGEMAVYGYARMTVLLMLVWILAGLFGFVHTKNIVVTKSPFTNILMADWSEIIKNILLISLDMVFLLVIFTDNQEGDEKNKIPVRMLYGVLSYVFVSGINMFKNLFMFGTDFLTQLDNPDLAAIRLIPMFELPEISVIVNTFAVTLRIAVYFCGMFYILKDSLGSRYKTKNIEFFSATSVAAVTLIFIYVIKNGITVEFIGLIGLVSLAFFVLSFFSEKEKR